MIHPIRPYGIRGIIWYQGERNSKDVPQAVHYKSQLIKLIGYYRNSWHKMSNGNVPKDFLFSSPNYQAGIRLKLSPLKD